MDNCQLSRNNLGIYIDNIWTQTYYGFVMKTGLIQSQFYPIKVVARRTGLTQDVLRAWERRYRAISPSRSNNDRRMYSPADIERLTLLRRLTELGRSIGQIARCPVEDLRRLLREDETPPPPPRDTARLHIDACREAVLALDSLQLHACLDRACLSMGRIAVLDQVLLPLLRDIGERWRNGSMRVMHEHFASSVIRTLMESFSIGSDAVEGSPLLLAATPAGQMHEMGALFTVASAAADGWRTLYLGPSLAAEEIAAAARQREAGAVALSLIHPSDDARLGDEMLRLRNMLPADVSIVVGGAAAPAYRETLAAIGAICPADLDEFRSALARLRNIPA